MTAPRTGPDASTQAMTRRATVDALIAVGSVAVVRLPDATLALDAVRALADGGVVAIEVTLTTPGALSLITALRADPALLVGAGSVLDEATARAAIDAGAQYVVSPVFDAGVLATAHAHAVPVMPGTCTPTEMLTAHKAGADLLKVFPADVFGRNFIKSVLAPMPFLELMPTGGVTPENAGDWIRAGAVAVGLGSALVDPGLIAARDWAALTARARLLTSNVQQARAGASSA